MVCSGAFVSNTIGTVTVDAATVAAVEAEFELAAAGWLCAVAT